MEDLGVLIKELEELAEEMESGENADIRWIVEQSTLVRDAIITLQEK